MGRQDRQNVKWVAELGSQTYGNPTVAGGVVFVGTNNEPLRDPKQPGDRGVVMAFKEATGEFLWQATYEKLSAGRANDWPFQGIASSPLSSTATALLRVQPRRGDCLDVKGFHDGENDGPYKDEKLTGQNDADVIWKFDMMEEVGAFPHNLANSSPVVFGELLYVMTSNGQDESHVNIPSPKAPAIIALDKDDRQAGVGGQLGRRQDPARPVVHAGGREDRRRGAGGARAGRRLGARLRGENRQEAVGVRHQPEGLGVAEDPQRGDQHAGDRRDTVYIANGQDPEHGEGVGHAYAIDATKRGDITTTGKIWHFDKIRRIDLDGGDQGRPDLLARLRGLPALPRSQDRPGDTGRTTCSPRSGARR